MDCDLRGYMNYVYMELRALAMAGNVVLEFAPGNKGWIGAYVTVAHANKVQLYMLCSCFVVHVSALWLLL